ncbi:MBG domain-containing protein [Flavobacterium sp. UW10123]|uniref:MBG domain-containing protein n=1 Tax=Flavobacterium sp. UW10123 TaxID=3230800 RepID=UPI0033995030
MKKKLLLFFTFFCIFGLHQNIKGQTLAPGDIAFLGFNSNPLDGFSFIVLKDLPGGTVIYFTERGWNGTAWVLGSTESHLKWTVPSFTPVGTIVSIMETTDNIFTVTGTSGIGYAPGFTGFSLSSGGDQILAYQSATGAAEPASPTFIAGIHSDYNSGDYNGTTKWNNTGTTGGNSSTVPEGLENGKTCISLFPAPGPEHANAKYNGTLTGNVADLLLSINNPANWLVDTTDNVNFQITAANYNTPNITLVVAPTVSTTTPVTNYGALTATLGGSNNDGGGTILSRGIVWSLFPNPVIGGSNVTNLSASIGTGPFSVNATSLPSGTTIHYAAYASNSAGITYGTPASFSTNTPLSATQSQKNACSGVNNGTATVTPSGGKMPYTYAWSTGSTAATVTGLMPSNYSVNITDAEGTLITKTFTIGQDSAIQGPYTVTNVSCFGGNNGSIDLTPTGGSGSYTYNWGGGITTQDRTNLAAGSYSVTITDSNNCSVVISNIAVGQPTAALNGTTVITNVLCNGANTGAINLTPTGGTGPYTFNWVGGPSTEDRTGLVAGTYTVTITDANSCSVTLNGIQVSQPAAISSASIVVTHVACFGNNTGAINLTPTGGVGPYTFVWSDGPTTEDRTGLLAGTYTVTITDANSCSKTLPGITINQPSSALGGTAIPTDVSCFGGSNGSINLTPTGGVSPYTFNWVGGASTEDRTGLVAGTYAVTITDANGCTATISNIAVGQPAAPLDGTVTVTPILCNGNNTGAINLTPTGGTAPYTFDWGGGVTTEDRTGLAAGTYSVTITDNHGCTKTIAGIQVSQPPAIATTTAITHIACNGAATGTINITPSGGVGPYTFLWNDGVTNEDRTGLTAGTYSVTITDNSSCSKTFNNITVGEPSALSGNISVNNVSCNGGSNGSIGLTVTGGVSPYTYSWTGGVTSQNRSGLVAGTYTVTITDSNSCTKTISDILVSQPPALVTSIEQNNVSCNGGSNGTATVNVLGGAGNYTYQWTPTGGNAATATGLQAGTYTVTVTDGNACVKTQDVTISEPAVLSATQTQTDVLCNGGSTGTATVNPLGGAGDYTYAWTPTGGSAATATGLAAGTYTCQITDKNGCFISKSFTINQPSALDATTSQTDATCSVGGEATVFPSGGVGGYTYSWSPSGGASATASGLTAGTYNCVITDGNGCSIMKSVTINTTNTLVASTTQVDVLCNGANTGSITVTPSGAPGQFTYEWTPNVGSTDTVNNLTAGNYSVKIIAANGCSITKDFTIVEPSAIIITPASQSNVSCKGGSNGSITPAITGGTGALTYSWNTNPEQTSATATGLKAGTYTLTVTDANSCTKTRNFTITEPDALTATTSQTDVSCNGGSNGSATVNVTGGTGLYTYSWSPSGGTNATASGLLAGTYTVTIKDANLCQTTASVTIIEPSALTATIAKTDVLCNQANNGTATVTPSGGTGTYTYSWSPSGGTAATATGLSPNTYTVTVTDENGCFVTESVQIIEPTALSATDTHTNVSCNGGNNGTATVVATGGTGAYTYSWSPSGGNAATATGLTAGTYTVTVTDENLCSTTNTIIIAEPDALSITATPVAVSCHNGSNGSVTVNVTGGTGAYTYSWSPSGGNAATATGLNAGTYTVTVTDANSCTKAESFIISEPDPLTATTSQTDVSCNGESNGTATVNVTGGTGTYTYSWSPAGGTNATATGLTAGNYTVTIKDANLCETTASVTIAEPLVLTATIAKTDVLCHQASNGTATVTASGGTGTYTYSWSPFGGNTATATGLSPNTYTVTVTDENGCFVTESVQITEPDALTATITKTDVLCNQANNGTASVAPSGGTLPYSYSWSPSGGSDAIATGLSPNTYSVTITDANGCSITETVQIKEPDPLVATTSQTDVSCNGTSNGTATVNVTGGTGTYTYSWSPAGGTNSTATGLTAGTYTVTIKDANLCETTASVIIAEPSALTAIIAKTDVLCNQANNGTATVTPSGGTGTYTYSWSPSGGTAATATGLSPNTYTVTVTDENGCFVTESVQITEPTVLSATDSHTNVSCKGGNNGTASVVANGGTGSYSYLWAPSGGTAATATGLTAGVYTVTVTDENSCTVTNTVTITEPDALTLTPTLTAVSCHNGSNGSAAVSVTGGTGAYSYSWSPSGGNAATATDLVAGTYTVTVTDANSCSASATVEVTQPANPVNLNTAVVSGITTTGASLSGTASSDGINVDSGSCLTEVGFVYAQHANPTTADTKINVTTALGTFTNSLTGLRGNRTYYVRTYAVNSNGFVNYGNEVSFTTQKYTLTITAAAGHTKVYGTTDPVFNYTALGFANGDTNSILTGLLSRDAGENVGKYNIKLGTINAGADYIINFTGAKFEITKANQTITWNQTLEFGCADSNNVTLTATTDSGLPVSYAIANLALGTISGSTLNITGSGNSTITATQIGDQNHNAATAVVKPIEISQSGLVIQQWANVLFFDNKSNNYVAWQWYKNGTAVSGATKQYYSELQPLNGTYYVIAKDKNGNSIKSCPIETTGTIFTKKIKVYPNPVKPNAEFTLECDFSESQLNGSEVVIYDIAGKLVQTISNVKAKNQIIAPSQTALYIVVLKLADGQLKTINLLVK